MSTFKDIKDMTKPALGGLTTDIDSLLMTIFNSMQGYLHKIRNWPELEQWVYFSNTGGVSSVNLYTATRVSLLGDSSTLTLRWNHILTVSTYDGTEFSIPANYCPPDQYLKEHLPYLANRSAADPSIWTVIANKALYLNCPTEASHNISLRYKGVPAAVSGDASELIWEDKESLLSALLTAVTLQTFEEEEAAKPWFKVADSLLKVHGVDSDSLPSGYYGRTKPGGAGVDYWADPFTRTVPE